jgi:hypothetical protein
MVPICTENGLRFSAHLGSGEPEVRFERVAVIPNPAEEFLEDHAA